MNNEELFGKINGRLIGQKLTFNDTEYELVRIYSFLWGGLRCQDSRMVLHPAETNPQRYMIPGFHQLIEDTLEDTPIRLHVTGSKSYGPSGLYADVIGKLGDVEIQSRSIMGGTCSIRKLIEPFNFGHYHCRIQYSIDYFVMNIYKKVWNPEELKFIKNASDLTVLATDDQNIYYLPESLVRNYGLTGEELTALFVKGDVDSMPQSVFEKDSGGRLYNLLRHLNICDLLESEFSFLNRLRKAGPLWQRIVETYEKNREALSGRILLLTGKTGNSDSSSLYLTLEEEGYKLSTCSIDYDDIAKIFPEGILFTGNNEYWDSLLANGERVYATFEGIQDGYQLYDAIVTLLADKPPFTLKTEEIEWNKIVGILMADKDTLQLGRELNQVSHNNILYK